MHITNYYQLPNLKEIRAKEREVLTQNCGFIQVYILTFMQGETYK